MKITKHISLLLLLLTAYLQQQAQLLDVSIVKADAFGNRMQIVGTATSPGFSTAPDNAWSAMNLTWRVPKSATIPAPTVAPPTPTPEVTGETTAFTGASPQSSFSNTLELVMFDLTTFGLPDDGFWYYQVTGSVETVQNIATGTNVVLYEFTVPYDWSCPDCMEIMVSDIPGLSISTTSFIDNGGMGQDVLNLVDRNAPLPVEWLNVKAEPKNNASILVRWATASEQNNAGFEVERSENGQSFETIAEVPGSGNSNTPKHYSYDDHRVNPGIKYYYRIKQIDKDGRASYSVIVSARILQGDQFTVEVKPNPVRYTLNLELQSTRKQTAQIVISDMAGKVYAIERSVTVESVATRYSRNVAAYPPGTYTARVIAQDGTTKTVKFIIAR